MALMPGLPPPMWESLVQLLAAFSDIGTSGWEISLCMCLSLHFTLKRSRILSSFSMQTFLWLAGNLGRGQGWTRSGFLILTFWEGSSS